MSDFEYKRDEIFMMLLQASLDNNSMTMQNAALFVSMRPDKRTIKNMVKTFRDNNKRYNERVDELICKLEKMV